jgi:hypothetical protein
MIFHTGKIENYPQFVTLAESFLGRMTGDIRALLQEDPRRV